MIMTVVLFLIPLIAGIAILKSGVDNAFIKAIGYALIAIFGLGIILLII